MLFNRTSQASIPKTSINIYNNNMQYLVTIVNFARIAFFVPWSGEIDISIA